MKKYIITVTCLILAVLLLDTAYYRLGLYIPTTHDDIQVWAKTEGNQILVDKGQGYEPFTIRGVDMGVGIPGYWATDYAISKQTYLRWFRQIQAMGANTIRIYTILHDDFYNAFYEYNKDNENPLFLLHGLWVNDYALNSHMDAFDEEFLGALLKDSKAMIDVLHGNRKLNEKGDKGTGTYTKDVSKWVLGYLPGVEWEVSNVVYTEQMNPDKNQYQGEYFCTTEDASPYEAMLAQLGDEMVRYETERYGQQRLLGFSNWPATDPFVYPTTVSLYRYKLACIDVEHIKTTESYKSGQFASYHVYTYYPDYLQSIRETKDLPQSEIDLRMGAAKRKIIDYRLSLMDRPSALELLKDSDFKDPSGRINTYYTYLKLLSDHHTMPVIISEFGITTGRGMAQRDVNTQRNQGQMSEQAQGNALVKDWQDIMSAGCAGGCVFSWQDEWFKRTWNTFPLVDLKRNPYWSDYQTNEQYFGLLTFDPGEDQSICYVDGDRDDWSEQDMVCSDGDYALYMKYDERFMYFMISGENVSLATPIYLPIDVTPKTGSSRCAEPELEFSADADFIIQLNGRSESRLLVQQRYDSLSATYSQEYYNQDAYVAPPDKDDPTFVPVKLPLTLKAVLPNEDKTRPSGEYYESGKLAYGNANPSAATFNSLADFCAGEDFIEIRIPWQLLNFADPTTMRIHDDYYERYGVEYLSIDSIRVGVGNGDKTIQMADYAMKPLGEKPKYHERLKKSYYILQAQWTAEEQSAG